MDVSLTKEEQEQLVDRKMEEMKRKNAELLRRHQLAEEDKRLAEEQGRSVTNKAPQTFYSPMKGEILRSAEEEHEKKTKQQCSKQRSVLKNFNQQKMEAAIEKTGDGPPPDPSCKFLADRRREGPLPNAKQSKEFSRRHPRNFGGTDFKDVPKKIHDERERQINQPQMKTRDFTICTTGKERRELEEWRKEREKIDRDRLERQKNKEGNWRREWDRDKDEASFVDHQNQPEHSVFQRQSIPAYRAAGRIGSGRFVLGFHKHSVLHKPLGTKENGYKGTNRGKWYQGKKVNPGDSKTSVPCGSVENKHITSEKVSALSCEKSYPRVDSRLVQDFQKRSLRTVHEKNDSLVIKVNNQPKASLKTPMGRSVSFVEPCCSADLHRNDDSGKGLLKRLNTAQASRSVSYDNTSNVSKDVTTVSVKKGRPNIRTPKFAEELSRSRNGSYNYSWVGSKDSGEHLTSQELGYFSKYSRSSRRSNDKNKEDGLRVESSSRSNDQLQNSPELPEIKDEKLVGSGRIGVHIEAMKRRSKNQMKRSVTSRSQPLKRRQVADRNFMKTNLEKVGTQNEDGNDEESITSPMKNVTQDKTCAPASFSHSEKKEVKAEESETTVRSSGEFSVKPRVAFDTLVDLDQDPPEDEQIDDEEWEDIDEEVCIDLINRGDESYEDNLLDLSSEAFDPLTNEEESVQSRGHVDWAAEMESVEHRSSVDEPSAVDRSVDPGSKADLRTTTEVTVDEQVPTDASGHANESP